MWHGVFVLDVYNLRTDSVFVIEGIYNDVDILLHGVYRLFHPVMFEAHYKGVS